MNLQDFLSNTGPIIDVRSPGEYKHSHIPNAISIPLFLDDERAEIGTVYKKVGQEQAIDLGIKIVAPKLPQLISLMRTHLNNNHLKIYCWRGGMRSNFVAQTLNIINIPAVVLDGGYKTFRRHALQTLSLPWDLKILGGLSGSKKTEKLHTLEADGYQVIDLEGLANHRGSSFGGIGRPPQPSTEYFENKIAHQLLQFNINKPVWVEDESHMIGLCKVPDDFHKNMQNSTLYELKISREERLQNLVKMYGSLNKDDLINAILRIQKQIGGARAKEACNYLAIGEPKEAIDIILNYYDKTYSYCLDKRKKKKEFTL